MRKTITTLWIALAALVAFGLVLVYSASVAQKGGAVPFMKMQTVAAAVGLLAAFVLSRLDYRVWQKPACAIAIIVLCVAASSLVFLFPAVNGSRRWVRLAGISLQPSEFTRIGMIMVMAAWYGKIGFKSRTFLKGFLYPGLILGLMAAPVALSPDLGATIVIAATCGTVMVAARVKWRYLILAVILCVLAGSLFVMSSPNRRSRVIAFYDSMRGLESSEDTAYHRNQSIEAFVRGGRFGSGIGRSIQKHKYLPEANTDFIFSIAGEELGLPATVSVVSAFLVILFCGVYIAYHAHDRFGRLLALGLTILLTFEAGFNVGMVTGCLPTKGLALPFISYGGTSMVASCLAMGLIIAVGATSANEEMSPLMRDACQNV
ncbi:MAG: cell division protein FtsW [Kiritimatiellae bacterium]|nr:cell division protein FtsW [Kiritimatiellia bacterium]